jgi:L-alanine-DL-glutamate epimerase-like enolase superfamily enzyme
MRVNRIETRLRTPVGAQAQRTVRDALQTLPNVGGVEVLVHTNTGHTGKGDVDFGRMEAAPAVVQTIIDEILAPIVNGRDPQFVRQMHEDMLRETEYAGSGSLVMFGISAVDTALWDLLGKAENVPVYRLLGAARDRVPAYAMVGWMSYSDDELKSMCTRAAEQGFRGVKLKVGYPSLEEDLRRIGVARGAIGKDMALMVDANQVLSTGEAIRRGRAFQEAGCYWFEEPLPAGDLEGYTELARNLDIPIATGENLYGRHAFAPFVAQRAVDVVQADLRRAGGPTEVLAIAALADAHRLPYASHGGGAVNLNLLGLMPNAAWLETGLAGPRNQVVLEKGCAMMPQGPGFSF